jgi:hypothetical protein
VPQPNRRIGLVSSSKLAHRNSATPQRLEVKESLVFQQRAPRRKSSTAMHLRGFFGACSDGASFDQICERGVVLSQSWHGLRFESRLRGAAGHAWQRGMRRWFRRGPASPYGEDGVSALAPAKSWGEPKGPLRLAGSLCVAPLVRHRIVVGEQGQGSFRR